jgi:hypothetical protein
VAEKARIAVVGVSPRPICGVRDHATLLAGALEREHVSCTWHWLQSSERSLAGSRSEMRAWIEGLAGDLEAGRPDAILLHYSVFAHSYRGIPLFVPPMVAALRRTGIPVITVMHELAFPLWRGGLKGAVWAATQRAVLIDVVRASAAILVTIDFRAQWLLTRPWLPKRPVAVAPVFSNLPQPTVGPPGDRAVPLLGLFGYALDTATVALVLDAVRELSDRGVDMRLRLLGSPGRDSAAGEMWAAMAHSRAISDSLSFSGTLSAQELSDALAESDILLYVDPMGPASRKGTLAGSLASARPLIALEGRRRWQQLIDEDAARVIPRTSTALAEAIRSLLADGEAREALGRRGGRFAVDTIGVARTAEKVMGLLEELHALRGA